MIQLLLRSSFGNLHQRNKIGYKPTGKIQKLSEKMVKLVRHFDPNQRFNGQYDYLFECRLDRFYVLID
jgi:hypothetical protein